MSGHVVILLASYQGSAHIGTQLDSIATQTHRDWSLIVSDDGSSDGTQARVRDFAAGFAAGRVQLLEGPGAGATRNFLSLLRRAPDGVALAFCDQDDLWYPGKLAQAMGAIRGHAPAHYSARTIIADPALRPLTGSRIFPRPLGFRNALVQACMAGNTSVFNPAAARILKDAAPAAEAAGIEAHDWWAYQVSAATGARLIRDPRPVLLYRQHPRSEIGRNDTLPALTTRVRKLMRGEFGGWLAAHLRSLEVLRPLMSPDSRALLDRCLELPGISGPRAVQLILQLGLYRQTPAGTAALLAAAAAGRLRAG